MTSASHLHPDMIAALAQVKALRRDTTERSSLPVARQRSLMEAERQYWNAFEDPHVREWAMVLPGPLRPVPVRVFQPIAPSPLKSWMVYLHGGGWMLGSTSTHAAIMRGLAAASDLTILAPDYALAPEFPFPRPVEETRWVMRHLSSHASELGLSASHMTVGGDSSGANIALAAALEVQREAPGTVKAGVFYYGVFDNDLQTGSAAQYGDGSCGLSVTRMRDYWDHYVPEERQRSDGRVNLLNADLADAFPMYLMAAECDLLRDGARRFSDRLAQARIPFQFSLRAGMAHGYMGYGRLIPDVAAVHAEAAAFLAAQGLTATQRSQESMT
jgi:acetyl esterase